MESRDERRARLKRASQEAAAIADQQAAEDLVLVTKTGAEDLRALLPKVSDPQLVTALITAVDESSKANESTAQLRARIEALGKGASEAVKEVATLLRG